MAAPLPPPLPIESLPPKKPRPTLAEKMAKKMALSGNEHLRPCKFCGGKGPHDVYTTYTIAAWEKQSRKLQLPMHDAICDNCHAIKIARAPAKHENRIFWWKHPRGADFGELREERAELDRLEAESGEAA